MVLVVWDERFRRASGPHGLPEFSFKRFHSALQAGYDIGVLMNHVPLLPEILAQIEEHLDVALFSLRRFRPLLEERIALPARQLLFFRRQFDFDLWEDFFAGAIKYFQSSMRIPETPRPRR